MVLKTAYLMNGEHNFKVKLCYEIDNLDLDIHGDRLTELGKVGFRKYLRDYIIARVDFVGVGDHRIRIIKNVFTHVVKRKSVSKLYKRLESHV